MNYYDLVKPKIFEGFEHASWFGAGGWQLVANLGIIPEGNRAPTGFFDISELEKFVDWGTEVYLPVTGRNIDTILFPYDYEIFLEGDPNRLYGHWGSQHFYFDKYVFPVTRHLSSRLDQFDVPRFIDLT